MANVITQPCIDCKDTACIDVCPTDSIHPRKDERAFGQVRMLYINPETCIDSGACGPACPVQAIFPVDLVPHEWKEYVEINRAYYSQG